MNLLTDKTFDAAVQWCEIHGIPLEPSQVTSLVNYLANTIVDELADSPTDHVTTVVGVDEFGPMFAWPKHWGDIAVGTRLYSAEQFAAARVQEQKPNPSTCLTGQPGPDYCEVHSA